MSLRKSTTRSSLAAGSSRRRRMMLNELMADKTDSSNEIDPLNNEELTTEAEPFLPLADETDFANWMSSINSKPLATKEASIKVEVEPGGSEDIFGQLVDLSEAEQKKVTSSKQQNSLEQQIPKFTEMVQSFDSPEVQREVFAALVKAFEKEQELKNRT